MQCANRELAMNIKTNPEYHRCAFDRELHVNSRMYCEEWHLDTIEESVRRNIIDRKQA